MNILLIQLSDMHCQVTHQELTKKLDKAVDVLSTFTPVDHAMLIFSGDLTDTASKKEYQIGSFMIGRFLKNLGERLNCGFINTLIVPGNHDMVLPEDSRKACDIEQWDKNGHLDEELQRLSLFFKYAQSKNCFKSDRIVDIRTISLGKFKIQVSLINSAPYSTREKEDKQLHYLPSYVGEKISQPSSKDTLNISVCHHSYEWFDWDSKEMLKRAFSQNDITFIGHDHKSESISMQNGDGTHINTVMGGKFTLDCGMDSTFNAVLFNTETRTAQCFEVVWNINDGIFTKFDRGDIHCMQENFHLSNDYLNHLLMDNQQLSNSLLDYFVFPKLIAESELFSTDGNARKIEIDDVFGTLNAERVIRFIGTRGAGKTTLLKYLYSESAKRGYYPLLIEKKDYRDSRIEKMFRDMVEIQYTFSGDHGYDFYEQKDHSSEIIFIDDIDCIDSDKARNNLINYIVLSGRLLVYSTKERNHDLEEVVKEKLQGKDSCSFEIAPFYKESRDELIEKICDLKGKGENDKATVKTSLDYLVQCQPSFFSSMPRNLLLYINYFLSAGAGETKGFKTLSLVFETNMRNSLLSCTPENNIIVVLAALEYISNYMYFDLQQETLDSSTFEKIVNDFNAERKAHLNAKQFLILCKKAHIFQEDDYSFGIKFSDKNIFAYFVAKYISREFERGSRDLSKLTYVMERICFGINDTIILFLSFIRSNTEIIMRIAEQAVQLLESYPEWDFDQNNIPFLSAYEDLTVSVPTNKEKSMALERTEQIERKRHEAVKFKGIFDYSEADINKEKYRIIRALKYTQLLGQALIDQYGNLNANEIDLITKTLYSATQKIIFAALKPYQTQSEEIVTSLLSFVNNQLPGEKISQAEIRKLLGQAGTAFALNIMDDISFNASNNVTIEALRDIELPNSNYKIMQLLMEENTGNTEEFISRSILLRKELDTNTYAKTLIAQIARVHIIYTSRIDHRQINRLISGKVIAPQGKKTLLLEQGKKAEN